MVVNLCYMVTEIHFQSELNHQDVTQDVLGVSFRCILFESTDFQESRKVLVRFDLLESNPCLKCSVLFSLSASHHHPSFVLLFPMWMGGGEIM